MVPEEGLEPSCLAAHAPQACLYTNSSTRASFTQGKAKLYYYIFKKKSSLLQNKKFTAWVMAHILLYSLNHLPFPGRVFYKLAGHGKTRSPLVAAAAELMGNFADIRALVRFTAQTAFNDIAVLAQE